MAAHYKSILISNIRMSYKTEVNKMEAAPVVIIPGVPGIGAAEPEVHLVIINPMDLALQWIAFEYVATYNRLPDEGLIAFEEKDIRDVAESYGRRTQGNGRFIFGVHRIHHLLGMLHWVQDFGRIVSDPSLNRFNDDPEAFHAALDVVSERAEERIKSRSFLRAAAVLMTRRTQPTRYDTTL